MRDKGSNLSDSLELKIEDIVAEAGYVHEAGDRPEIGADKAAIAMPRVAFDVANTAHEHRMNVPPDT